MNSLTDTQALRQVLWRWRSRFFACLVPLLFGELVFPIARWPESLRTFAFFLYLGGTVVLLGLAILFWRALYRYALEGGSGYAAGHVLLSVLLTPFAFLGIGLLPVIVQADIAEGRAAWRRGSTRPFREKLLRTVLYFTALTLVALLLWETVPLLLILAPILAFFLQRLVLPWFQERATDTS